MAEERWMRGVQGVFGAPRMQRNLSLSSRQRRRAEKKGGCGRGEVAVPPPRGLLHRARRPTQS
jgi:hypothetical protein